MGHLKQGSILVKPGDRVTKGQVIAQMGRSGMGSGLIHVHYQLQDRADLFNSEPLPFRFDAVRPIGAPAFQSERISPGMIFETPPAAKAKK
jgi:murein DD-endopeptidase MepM/ murein hydrolase activator NlpD